MKSTHSLFIILILCSTAVAYTQSPILSLYANQGSHGVENAYYKDLDNVQSPYVGTWLLDNGTTVLKVMLRKRIMVYVTGSLGNTYEDVLVGEYLYSKNGAVRVNTLENLSQEYEDNTDYNLHSAGLMRKSAYPKCNECAEGEKRLTLYINDPARRHLSGLSNELIIRRFFDSGVEKLKVWFPLTGNGIVTDENFELSNVRSFNLPHGEYVLTKQ